MWHQHHASRGRRWRAVTAAALPLTLIGGAAAPASAHASVHPLRPAHPWQAPPSLALLRADSPSVARNATVRAVRSAVAPIARAPDRTALSARETRIPLRFDVHGRPIAEGRIEGSEPLRFVLDLGATVLAVTPLAADRLGLAVARRPDGVAVTRTGVLQVGDALFEGLPARVLDLPEGVDGVLGLNVFADLLLTLDYERAELRLSVERLTAGDGVVPYVPDAVDGLPTIPVTVAGEEVPAFLDSGASSAALLPRALAAQLPWRERPVPIGELWGPDMRPLPVDGGRVKGPMHLGAFELRDPIVTVADVPAAGARMAIGSPVLRRLVVSIDQRERLVALRPAADRSWRPPPMRDAGFRVRLSGDVAVVTDVLEHSPAERRGLQVGDEIVSIDGRPLSVQMAKRLDAEPGTAAPLQLSVRRQGERVELLVSPMIMIP